MAVLPVNQNVADDSVNPPRTALHIMSIGVRVGDKQRVIGYVTSINRTHGRKTEHLWQLEPYPISMGSGFQSQNDIQFPGTDAIDVYPTSRYYPGEAVEVVPGPLTEETVALERYTLFTSTIFEAFMRAGGQVANAKSVEDAGTRLVSLLQQTRPVDLYEIWVSPITGVVVYGIIYQDCWFESMGHTADIKGDITIAESATLHVTRTRPYFTS